MTLTPGQFVHKGDLLFEFDARDQELALALAQARLKPAEAQLRLAEATLKIAQSLRSNAASELQFLEADARRDVAIAQLEEARTNVQVAELALSQMKLYAPISGIIGHPLINIGTFITKESREQSRLATIAQLDPIHVVGRVSASAYFQPGATSGNPQQAAQQREFSLTLPTGETYPHRGRFVSGVYAFDPASQTVEVTVEFPNPDLLLRPGLEVKLRSSAVNQ
jgi:RND family efflux transporter MFP subunit